MHLEKNWLQPRAAAEMCPKLNDTAASPLSSYSQSHRRIPTFSKRDDA